MDEQVQLADAIALASALHSSQFDFSGEPYILHCIRIMMNFTDPVLRTVAILHDVVEDTDITIENLRELGFSETVLTAVNTLTRVGSEPYENYIQRVKNNALARAIKLADLKDNMDGTRLVVFGDYETARMKKYLRALKELI